MTSMIQSMTNLLMMVMGLKANLMKKNTSILTSYSYNNYINYKNQKAHFQDIKHYLIVPLKNLVLTKEEVKTVLYQPLKIK